jgi:hypothetical protein
MESRTRLPAIDLPSAMKDGDVEIRILQKAVDGNPGGAGVCVGTMNEDARNGFHANLRRATKRRQLSQPAASFMRRWWDANSRR